MCGITGKLNLRSDEPVTFETVARMCQVLWHRGPDAERMVEAVEELYRKLSWDRDAGLDRDLSKAWKGAK